MFPKILLAIIFQMFLHIEYNNLTCLLKMVFWTIDQSNPSSKISKSGYCYMCTNSFLILPVAVFFRNSKTSGSQKITLSESRAEQKPHIM
jgi:hypothetical protein